MNKRPTVPLYRTLRWLPWLVCLLLIWIPVTGSAETPTSDPAAQNSLQWWTPHYLADYALFAGGLTAYMIGKDRPASSNARIGPSYDPDNPAQIFDNTTVGRTYRAEGSDEMVPTRWIHYLIGVGAGLVAGIETHQWRRNQGSMQSLHDGFVGYAETVALTAGVTETLKPLVGRLRPDFGERARRFHCSEPGSQQLGTDCDGYRDRPLADDPNEAFDLLEDGRRSFISGHSSHSFNLLSYTTLIVGGRYVWGDHATARSRVAGLAAQGSMMATATYISASRLIDGRHHTTDVAAGALIGMAIANFSYWRRFDRRGVPRRSPSESATTTVEPTLGFQGIMISFHY